MRVNKYPKLLRIRKQTIINIYRLCRYYDSSESEAVEKAIQEKMKIIETREPDTFKNIINSEEEYNLNYELDNKVKQKKKVKITKEIIHEGVNKDGE